MTAVLYCAKGIKNKIEVRSVTSKRHSVGLVLLVWKGGEQTCLFICFLRVDFVLVLFRCGVEKEARHLSEKRHCDSLCSLRSAPGVLSRLPTASWADLECLGENDFSTHALGWADTNRAFMNLKHGCWWAAYPQAKWGFLSPNDFMSREGVLKTWQMLQTWNLKGEDISRTKSWGVGSGKNGWRPNWHFILLQLTSEELCKQLWGSIVFYASLVSPEKVLDSVESKGVGEEAIEQRAEALKFFLHWQCPGFYWYGSLLTLFRKCRFSVICIRAWKYHSVCIYVGIVAFGNHDPEEFCWGLGSLEAFCMKDASL